VVVAFREFHIITDETIASERKRFRAEVVVSIEDFAKRSTLRNLKRVGRLDKAKLGLAYDHFQLAVLKGREEGLASAPRSRAVSSASTLSNSKSAPPQPLSPSLNMEGERPDKPEERINRRLFGSFISGIATWARDEKVVKNGFHEHVDRTPAEHELIDRIFVAWDIENQGALSFQVRASCTELDGSIS
jgi:hypothetical protein